MPRIFSHHTSYVVLNRERIKRKVAWAGRAVKGVEEEPRHQVEISGTNVGTHATLVGIRNRDAYLRVAH